MYQYQALVVRWVDGDTVDLRVDLGFRTTVETRFRLLGVDTPERGEPGYSEATAYSATAAPVGSVVVIDTRKAPDSFGRWLVEIHLPSGVTLSDALIGAGLARVYT